jgi:hypothetical protein
MPAIIANAQNFLLTSDFPIDKVSGYNTGSISVPANTSLFPTFAHGLSYAPTYFLKWSTTANFSISFDELGTSTVNNLQLTATIDLTTIYLFISNVSNSAVTIYYRFIFFMPPDINKDVLATVANLDVFMLNTDYNYTKLFLDDKTTSNIATISHNLGYYPQVEAWTVDSNNKIGHIVSNELTDITYSPSCEVTTNQIILRDPSAGVSYWYYKVYIDVT